ncbi:MAG: hypothetical protein HY689_09905 [Chloroflexi bacterium]|nr:hypothetical protein [Chloroflexota bacterium]
MTARTVSAEAIRRGLACGRSGCPCARERGNVHCPVPNHGQGRGDRNPSFAVTEAADGATLVHCFSGCSQGAVLDALRDLGLWPEAGAAASAGRRNGAHPDPGGAGGAGGAGGSAGERGRKERKSQATQLVELAGAWGARPFHDPEGTAWASIPGATGDWRETWPVRSSAFRRWMQACYFVAEGTTPSAQALQDALGVLEGLAIFPAEAREFTVHTRLAGDAGRMYFDLSNPTWQAIEVTQDGWRVKTGYTCPVKFRRTKGMLALPLPAAGGSVEELRQFVNVASDDDFKLLVAWLVAALRDRGPYPVLVLHGEQGSAKTTTARTLRSLVDPSTAPVRAEPRDGRDLMIAARNGWVVALDNLSHVAPWLSDALCRLATGGGFATRTLYSDDEETIFDAQRPVILTGIEELATRPDLLDRSIVLYLPAIPEDQRRTEAAFWRDFETARPRILGALLDAVAGALRDLPSTQLDRLPRMADFALWVTAAESALGWPRGSFLRAYAGNREGANDLALDASAIAGAVREFAAEHAADGGWSGSATELLAALNARLAAEKKPPWGWPGNGRALSNALRRIASNLRAAGVSVEFIRLPHTRRRVIIITTLQPPPGGGSGGGQDRSEEPPDFASPASPASPQARKQAPSGDANSPSGDAKLATGGPTQARGDAGDAGDAKMQPLSNEGDGREEATL